MCKNSCAHNFLGKLWKVSRKHLGKRAEIAIKAALPQGVTRREAGGVTATRRGRGAVTAHLNGLTRSTANMNMHMSTRELSTMPLGLVGWEGPPSSPLEGLSALSSPLVGGVSGSCFRDESPGRNICICIYKQLLT